MLIKLLAILVLFCLTLIAGCEKISITKTLQGQPFIFEGLSKSIIRIDSESLAIVGIIDSSTPDEFRRILNSDSKIKRIHLRSGGGIANAAMEMGRDIRKRRLDIVVDDRCYSACANYLFIAGIRKSVVQGGMLLMHGGTSFNHSRVYAQFPKATARNVATRAIAQLSFPEIEGNPAYFQTYKAFLESARNFSLNGLPVSEQIEIQYFSDMGVSLDLLHFSDVVCSCDGVAFVEIKIEMSDIKEKSATDIKITSTHSTRSKPTWYVPPKRDWIAAGVSNIDEFWTPSATERAIDFVKTGGKVHLETKPISELREADCIK